MNSESNQSCPKCHAPIPEEAPQGLCPKCLLAAASLPTEAGQPQAATPPPAIEAVSTAFPQLEIVEFIGQGGMGYVYKARQPKLDRFVALKLLLQQPGADPSFAERFNREARVLARLSHPNIVAVHDFGQAGPFFYLLMEFVDGVNLRQAMRAGRFTPAQALALVPKICDALQYAHEEGVLHRDIKPENLLLDTRGRLKIADFGIAKILGDAKDITLTASGASIGTPHYMAPEQLERPQDVDQRADVYSLGVVFYEMLTGELPIGRFAPPSEKTAMDPRVDPVVLRTLEKERERRFQSAGDVKTQVERITGNPTAGAAGPTGTVNLGFGGGSPPVPPPGSARVSASDWSHWSVRAVLAATLVGLSLIVLLLTAANGRQTGPGETVGVLIFAGIPGLVGTLLGWRALLDLRSKPQVRGARLAWWATVLCPLLSLDVFTLWVLLLCLRSFQWHVLHVNHGPLLPVAVVVGAAGILVLNAVFLDRRLVLWKSERALPFAGIQHLLSGIRRRNLVASGIAFAVILFVLVVNRAHINQNADRFEPPPVQVFEPEAPPGFEVLSGSPPGDDGRVYRSSVTVPPGYALTLSAVLCSNRVALRSGWSNAAVSLFAPKGNPVQAQCTWRLLGNTTFADGAPIHFSLALAGLGAENRSFHLLPPEPLTVNWVSEPPQLWPPLNGHTKFLILRGGSSSPGADSQTATEWAVGVEARLDPIPETTLRDMRAPILELGSAMSAGEEASPGAMGTEEPAVRGEDTEPISTAQVGEYKRVCGDLDSLLNEEKELLVHFTSESAIAKGVRERINSLQGIKQKLEEDHPGLLSVKPRSAASQPPRN